VASGVSAHTLVDTGPLVAWFSRAERYHEWAVAQFRRLKPPLLTCEAVLTETCFLLRTGRIDPAVALDAVRRGAIKLDFSLHAEVESVNRLMRRFANIGPSLANICLVRMSEIHSDCKVLTLDRNFLIYRREGRRVIPLIAPFDA
jgi:predicted nucleic acid-binding protein